MKFVIDASVLLAVGRGDHLKIQFLGWHRKCDVVVPEPVVLHTAFEVRSMAKAEAVRRWTMLVAEVPRIAWTPAVTEKLLALERPPGLHAITAAHALASDATVLTLEEEAYAGIAGLRVDAL